MDEFSAALPVVAIKSKMGTNQDMTLVLMRFCDAPLPNSKKNLPNALACAYQCSQRTSRYQLVRAIDTCLVHVPGNTFMFLLHHLLLLLLFI